MIRVKAKKDKAYAGDKLLQVGQELVMIYEDLKGNPLKRKATYRGFDKKKKLFLIEKESITIPGETITLNFRAEGINAQKIYVEG